LREPAIGERRARYRNRRRNQEVVIETREFEHQHERGQRHLHRRAEKRTRADDRERAERRARPDAPNFARCSSRCARSFEYERC